MTFVRCNGGDLINAAFSPVKGGKVVFACSVMLSYE